MAQQMLVDIDSTVVLLALSTAEADAILLAADALATQQTSLAEAHAIQSVTTALLQARDSGKETNQ